MTETFTWNDVLNHLQSFTSEQLNQEVEINVSGGDYMTIRGITTETVYVHGTHYDVPVLEV